MAITFAPKAGMILMCDFSGYVVPEIIKKRPVIVISPNHLKRYGLVTVVPLSTTPPTPPEGHHLEIDNLLKNDGTTHWVKCDMVATVRLERLDRVKTGKRTFSTIYVSKEQLKQIRQCVALSLGVDIAGVSS